MTTEPPMRRLTVTIPVDLVAGMEDLASIQAGSVSDVVREAVSEHLFATHWEGVGKVASTAILNGATNEEALEAVLDHHPGAVIALRSIGWYRSLLRRMHGAERVMTDGEVKRARERVGY